MLGSRTIIIPICSVGVVTAFAYFQISKKVGNIQILLTSTELLANMLIARTTTQIKNSPFKKTCCNSIVTCKNYIVIIGLLKHRKGLFSNTCSSSTKQGKGVSLREICWRGIRKAIEFSRLLVVAPAGDLDRWIHMKTNKLVSVPASS